jgi:recombination protein RecT
MNTAIEKRNNIQGMIQAEKFKSAMADVLPKHVTPDRMARVAIAAMTKTPKLLECSPVSVMGALMTASETGLEPDGRMGHLVPFGKEAVFIPDYKGIVSLIQQAGVADAIDAFIIREKDTFEHSMGLVTEHTYIFGKDRGEIIGAWARFRLSSGEEKHEMMTVEQLEHVRSKSSASKKGPWVDDYEEMCKKTVAKRGSKWIPWKAPAGKEAEFTRMNRALAADNAEYIDVTPTKSTTLDDVANEIDGEGGGE